MWRTDHRIPKPRVARSRGRKLLDDPTLWLRARHRPATWRETQSRHAHFLTAWDGLMETRVDRVAAAIVDPGDRGQRLRRASPFAFVLESAERWQVWRKARADESAQASS